jgi:hypothetical protein
MGIFFGMFGGFARHDYKRVLASAEGRIFLEVVRLQAASPPLKN